MDFDTCNITEITKGEKGDPGGIGLTGDTGPAGAMINGWKLDGNTEGFEKYFGTNDNFDIPLRTNNVVRGIFNKLGNFGFGESTVDADTRVQIKGFDSTASFFALKIKNSSNTPLLYVRNDGNVGIGTASPNYKLEVNGNSLILGTNTGSYFNFGTLEEVFIRGGKTGSKVYLNDNHNGNVDIASGGGFVGIGTSSDGVNKLLVSGGNTYLAGELTVANYAVNLLGLNTGSYFNYGVNQNVYIRAGKTNQDVYVQDNHNGLVGIGTQVVSAKLHIKGTSSISADFALKVDNSSSTNIIKARNDGYVIKRSVNAAIADADLAVNEMSSYISEAGNLLIFKVKYSSGVVKTTSLALI